MNSAGRIEKILRNVERETFQYLQMRYPLFLQSPEYVLLLAQERTYDSKKVQAYQQLNLFLDFVRENNEFPYFNGIPIRGNENLNFDFSSHSDDLVGLLQNKVFVSHGKNSKEIKEEMEKEIEMNRYNNEKCYNNGGNNNKNISANGSNNNSRNNSYNSNKIGD